MSARPISRTLAWGLGAAALVLGSGCEPAADTTNPGEGANSGDAPAVAPVWPDEAFRATRPEPRPIEDIKFPKIHTFELDNGLEVYLVEQNKLPTINMSIQFDGGGNTDPASKAGLASVCMDLFSEGTKSKDKVAFSEAQADIAATVSSWASEETTSVTLRVLEDQLPEGLDLLAEMMGEPGMRADDLKRIVERSKASLTQSKATPASIARRLTDRLVFGKGHPYGHLRTDKSLSAISLSDCKRYVKRLKPDGARLWVVGKIDEAKLRAVLKERLGTWKGKAPKAKAAGPAKGTKGKVYFVQADGAVQSTIYVAHPGPDRDAEDYEATRLMGMILGGSFSSRINMNLREDKGYSYGGRGNFRYKKKTSVFVAGAPVEVSTTALALREVAKEIEGMRAAPPTAEEVAREQEGALLELPGRFSTPTETLGTFRSLVFHGLPLDWYEQHQTKLREVDATKIHDAAKAHLPSTDSGWVVLVVGDGTAKAKDSEQTVLEAVKAIADEGIFGKGGFATIDADGKPVTAKKSKK